MTHSKTAQTPIKLYLQDYQKIIGEIQEVEGKSACFSWVLKRNKGWTYRHPYHDEIVYIDFWNDNAKSMFLLSYSHLIANSLKSFNKNNG